MEDASDIGASLRRGLVQSFSQNAVENFVEQGINSTFYLCFLLFTLHYASLLPALHHVSYVANAMMFTHGK